jgi:AcrR family transcriptional regulator
MHYLDKRSERGIATKQRLIETATRLFTDHGFAATSIDLVLRSCDVSRGALYHHFPNKEALFLAVLEQTEAEISDGLKSAAMAATNPLDALRFGCRAWLELALDPKVSRIALIDAPSVIGWQAWREIEGRNGLGLLKIALASGAKMGRLPEGMVEVYAHMLLATLIEMALIIARSHDAAASRTTAQIAIEQLISRLFGVEANGAWDGR